MGAASAYGISGSLTGHCLTSHAPYAMGLCSLATPGEDPAGPGVTQATVATDVEGASSKHHLLQCGTIPPPSKVHEPCGQGCLHPGFKDRAPWNHRCATQAQSCWQMGPLQRNITGIGPRNRATVGAEPPRAMRQGCTACCGIWTATTVSKRWNLCPSGLG